MTDTNTRTRAADWWDVTRRSRGERSQPGLFEREEPMTTGAWKQLLRCFGGGDATGLPSLTSDARRRLADDRPVDPNDPEIWSTRSDHVSAVLLRHSIDVSSRHISEEARERLIEMQRSADRDAGLDWTIVATSVEAMDSKLKAAHAGVIDLDDPALYAYASAKARAVGRRHGLDEEAVEDLARYALAAVDRFDPQDPRCWRLGTRRWGEVVTQSLGAVAGVDRPVGVFLQPVRGSRGSWSLTPTFSSDMIRLILQLEGAVSESLQQAAISREKVEEFLVAINHQVFETSTVPLQMLRRPMRTPEQLKEALREEADLEVSIGPVVDPRDRWGRISVTSVGDTLRFAVVTNHARQFPNRLLGRSGGRRSESNPSRAMALGEAVATAAGRELPVVLGEAAMEALDGRVRIGRMAGRPGELTITTAAIFTATSRRLAVDRAIPQLRALKQAGTAVSLDPTAVETIAMSLARPLADDPILLGRQQAVTPLMVLGSGLNASQTATGKTIMAGRAIYHRAVTTPRFRGMLVAQGLLLPQWRDELTRGAPERRLPPLAPNVRVVTIEEASSVAAQLQQADRDAGDEALLLLVSKGMLERLPHELAALRYHLLLVEEAQSYRNPATEAHRSLRELRMRAVLDCWLLSATPKSKRSEEIDILVGLAIGDEVMIDERPNVREAGDLVREENAHRVRIGYGPHMVRVTKDDMRPWMPEVRPARAMAVEPDGALADLLQAIREGGQRAYGKLVALLRRARALEPGSAAHRAALAEIARAQGVVLGNVGVFLDASVDPETLLHSRAALAIALARDGLVEPAVRGGGDGLPLLRGAVAEVLNDAAAGGVQTLVFAERVNCLHQLAGTLRDRHGLEAHVGDGSVDPETFAEIKRRFLVGEFSTLLLSSVGQEGHNLQTASLTCNLDFPWTTPPLEQRLGRAARPGATSPVIDVINPYIKGGAIEHVVSILAPRGAESHHLLDGFEGMRPADSAVASQLGEITAQVAASRHDEGRAVTAAKLRVAAAVFGKSEN